MALAEVVSFSSSSVNLSVLVSFFNISIRRSSGRMVFLPPAKFAKVMFSQVSVCPQWGRESGVCQHALQVSRPTPRGEVEGSGLGGGSPGPHPGGKLRELAWGVGVSRPTSGGGIPACTKADPPADEYCCRRYASYWNAFLFSIFLHVRSKLAKKHGHFFQHRINI